mmetsp:Transcript_27971/g.59901  ORF Transcript_27971/g.59901 Transcript_27971/m.59901 type:complete len:254 (+) Transcript_27971:1480-2241(+)
MKLAFVSADHVVRDVSLPHSQVARVAGHEGRKGVPGIRIFGDASLVPGSEPVVGDRSEGLVTARELGGHVDDGVAIQNSSRADVEIHPVGIFLVDVAVIFERDDGHRGIIIKLAHHGLRSVLGSNPKKRHIILRCLISHRPAPTGQPIHTQVVESHGSPNVIRESLPKPTRLQVGQAVLRSNLGFFRQIDLAVIVLVAVCAISLKVDVSDRQAVRVFELIYEFVEALIVDCDSPRTPQCYQVFLPEGSQRIEF